MDCKKIEELLSPYLEKELTQKDHYSVEEHLKTCQSCTALLSSLQEARNILANFPQVEVSQNLSKRLYSIPSENKKPIFVLDFFLRPSLQPLFAAVSVFLVMFSLYFFNPEKNLIDRSIDRQIHTGYSKIGQLYTRAESFASSLGEYKNNIIFSLKKINPLKKLRIKLEIKTEVKNG